MFEKYDETNFISHFRIASQQSLKIKNLNETFDRSKCYFCNEHSSLVRVNA